MHALCGSAAIRAPGGWWWWCLTQVVGICVILQARPVLIMNALKGDEVKRKLRLATALSRQSVSGMELISQMSKIFRIADSVGQISTLFRAGLPCLLCTPCIVHSAASEVVLVGAVGEFESILDQTDDRVLACPDKGLRGCLPRTQILHCA